jgi:hypothetical protein
VRSLVSAGAVRSGRQVMLCSCRAGTARLSAIAFEHSPDRVSPSRGTTRSCHLLWRRLLLPSCSQEPSDAAGQCGGHSGLRARPRTDRAAQRASQRAPGSEAATLRASIRRHRLCFEGRLWSAALAFSRLPRLPSSSWLVGGAMKSAPHPHSTTAGHQQGERRVRRAARTCAAVTVWLPNPCSYF